PVYNFPAAVRLDGTLDRRAVHQALAKIVARHSILRTTLRAVSGRPVQIVAPIATPALPEMDLAALPPAASQGEAERRTADEAQAPSDLARGPLVRGTLLRLAADRHVLLLTFHHVVTDGWSFSIFIAEFAALYAEAVTGRAADLPALSFQYSDFARWQRT